ncbi:hypothetical protein LCGC14_1986230, partial [marine sediment metagenome]
MNGNGINRWRRTWAVLMGLMVCAGLIVPLALGGGKQERGRLTEDLILLWLREHPEAAERILRKLERDGDDPKSSKLLSVGKLPNTLEVHHATGVAAYAGR